VVGLKLGKSRQGVSPAAARHWRRRAQGGGGARVREAKDDDLL
jgi:hypothetical protein